MTLFFIDNPSIGGIFNIGTGKARSWNDVANALFKAVGSKPEIEYVPMPAELQGKYQYFTEADIKKLRAAGCMHQCMSLEDAINYFVNGYLKKGTHLGE